MLALIVVRVLDSNAAAAGPDSGLSLKNCFIYSEYVIRIIYTYNDYYVMIYNKKWSVDNFNQYRKLKNHIEIAN